MRRRIGKRALFFAATALVCGALVPATPAAFRWVAWGSAGLAGFWAIMFAVQDMLAGGPEEPIRSYRVAPESETPFPPPPPPGRPPGHEARRR